MRGMLQRARRQTWRELEELELELGPLGPLGPSWAARARGEAGGAHLVS